MRHALKMFLNQRATQFFILLLVCDDYAGPVFAFLHHLGVFAALNMEVFIKITRVIVFESIFCKFT